MIFVQRRRNKLSCIFKTNEPFHVSSTSKTLKQSSWMLHALFRICFVIFSYYLDSIWYNDKKSYKISSKNVGKPFRRWFFLRKFTNVFEIINDQLTGEKKTTTNNIWNECYVDVLFLDTSWCTRTSTFTLRRATCYWSNQPHFTPEPVVLSGRRQRYHVVFSPTMSRANLLEQNDLFYGLHLKFDDSIKLVTVRSFFIYYSYQRSCDSGIIRIFCFENYNVSKKTITVFIPKDNFSFLILFYSFLFFYLIK